VIGAKVVPVATAVSTATSMLAAKSRELRGEVEQALSERDEFSVHHLTVYADYAAAVDRLRALELELRGPDGALIPTESIEISDSEFLADLVRRELECEFDEGVPDDAYESESDNESEAGEENGRYGAEALFADEDLIAQMEPLETNPPAMPCALYQIRVHLLESTVMP
jgi:hypothetical protein